MANWFIWREAGYEEGPLSVPQLNSMAKAKKLKPSDRLRREDRSNYVKASLISGIFDEGLPSTPHSQTTISPQQSTVRARKNKLNSNELQHTIYLDDASKTNHGGTSPKKTTKTEIFVLGLFLGLCVLGIYRSGIVGFYSYYYGPKTLVTKSIPLDVRNGPTGQVPTNPNEEAKNQLVQLNQRIEDWKARKDRLQMLINNLDRDKAELVKKLKALGASPTDQKSNDPKGAVLLAELRDVLKQSLLFEKKHKEYDLAIFKSESRVRTIDRRIAAKEVAGTDEELAELIRSMIELDESLDSESKEEIPIELDDLVKNSLAATPDSWKKNSVSEEPPTAVKQDGLKSNQQVTNTADKIYPTSEFKSNDYTTAHIAQTKKQETPNPNAVNLLQMIQLPKHAIRATWKMEGELLNANGRTSPSGGAMRIPYKPKGPYTLTIRARRQQFGGIIVPIVYSGTQFGVFLAAGYDESKIPNTVPETKAKANFFPSKDWHTVTLKVDANGIRCDGDSGANIEWNRGYGTVQGRPYDIPDPKELYLKVYDQFEIDKLEIVESGR